MKLAVASLLSVASALSTSHIENVQLFEQLRGVPEGWEAIGVPDAGLRMQFRIALKLPNPAAFHQTLNDIADPRHVRYGKHLSREELKDLVKPRPDSTLAVCKWLQTFGVHSDKVTHDGEFINFEATIAQAEAMMDTKFKQFQNLHKRNIRAIRTLQYSLPRDLLGHVDMVQPTTRFVQIKPESSQIYAFNAATTATDLTCNSTSTPKCLVDLYKIGGVIPTANDGFLGVSGFLNQYAQFDDLTKFAQKYSPDIRNASFAWQSIVGGLLTQNPNVTVDTVEANLDVQYTVGLVNPLPILFYSTAGLGPLVPDLDQPTQESNQNEPYLEYFSYLLNLTDEALPHTITTSYAENEQSVPANFSQVICNMIGQLGARGVSVIFSSGDTGVGSACQTNDGKNSTRFQPIFPPSCPYVTSVGATYRIEPERAIEFSSGGFSDRWERPWWQEDAVSGFLSQLGDRWQGLYNAQGRGFPDVAAQGSAFRVFDKGREISVSGTSASSPVFASVVALLNAARKQAGQPTLGFLNPFLYMNGMNGGFTDIVDGGSTGCNGRSIYSGLQTPRVPYASWNATKGWDPVTGLGTPLFDGLLKLAIQTPAGLKRRYEGRRPHEVRRDRKL